MDAALALDQQLVDIGGGPADMRIGWAHIAFLVAAHADAAAAWPADIAGRERNVHQRPVGAVVVVAPDQALLVGEHRAPAAPPSFGSAIHAAALTMSSGRSPVISRRLLEA